MPRLTKRLVESIEPESRDILVWDSEIKGFAVKVTPAGKRIYLLYYRVNGRQRKPKIGQHGSITCDQAREIARYWTADVAKGKDPSLEKQTTRKAITVRELSERYLEEYAKIHKKPASIALDEINLRCHIVPALGSYRISTITRKDIEDFHRSMKVHPISANRCLALISKMMTLAEKWGLRADAGTLCKHITKYPEKKRERYLSVEEMRRLGEALRQAEISRTVSTSAIAAIKLLLFTGCRRNEILRLRWEHVDLKNACLRLLDSKTGARTIHLPPVAVELLNGLPKEKSNPYVLPGKNQGEPLINLRKPWKRITKTAKIQDLTIHDLRHSFASVGVSGGMSLALIKGLLGHTQVRTTERYSHLANDPLKLAVHTIGNQIAATLDGKKAEVVRLKGIN